MKYKQRYWLRAIVQTDRDDGRDSRQYRNVPYRVEVDFDRIFAERGISGRLDRHSVCVVKAGDNDCEAGLRETHYYLSEEWLCGNKGTIHWLIDEIGEEPLEYRIYYDSTDSGPFAPPAYIGLVGDGDALRFNDGRAHPLHVGLAANPIAIDWDGDGAIDIISPQIYSHAAGSPWHVVRFFRNEGSNERPLFGEGIALTADIAGRREPIRTGYCIELCDMNGDGLPDLLNCAYTDADNRLQVFVNTGERDDITGLPRLRLDDTVPLGLSGQIICIRAIDLHGDGRISLLVGYITQAQYADIDDPLWFTATDEQKRQAQWPRWYYRSYIALYENNAPAAGQLSFAPPVTLLADDGLPISYYTCANFEVVNHTGGMAFDLLVNSHAPNLHEGYLTLAYYKHAGEGRRPVFAKAGTIGGLADRNSLIVRQCRNAAFDGLLVVPGASGGKIVHYRCVGTNEAGLPQYEREGYVQQRNAYVHAHAGYAQGQAIDDDGDGDWDIVAGCETGFVTRIGNSGTQRRPVFEPYTFMCQGGKPIELLNGPFSDPGSFMEASIGQTAPTCIDWDLDGALDLLVVAGDRLVWYRNRGTSSAPDWAEPVEVTAEDGSKVHKHRNKPAIVDWDGDGLPDIIGHDPRESRLLWFRRYRDEQSGELKLASGVPLLYADGSPVEPRAWHRYTKFFNAADWKGKGSNDLFLSTCDLVLYLENVGTNEAPRFLPPVRLAVDGIPVVIGHHVSTPQPVDWDLSGALDLLVSGESGLFHLFRRACLDGVHRRLACTIV